MIKRVTFKLDEQMMKELTLQAMENGFTNHSAYFRYLLTQNSKDKCQKEIVNKDKKVEAADLDFRLQELEGKIDQVKTQVKVNEQALMLLLAFFDIEKIPARGLQNARRFLAKKALEIKSGGQG